MKSDLKQTIDPTVLASLDQLKNWINRSEWQGFDPYDVKSQEWVRNIAHKALSNKIYEGVRELLYELFLLFPIQMRKISGTKPTRNAKGIGLICSGFLDLYQVTGEQPYLEQSRKALRWLIDHKIKLQKGFGWGYPFDWQSSKLVPAHTPNGIVTTAVGEAVWKWYKFSNNPEYLEICKEIAAFLISLPKFYYKKNELCFAYTPLFQNHVHNLNLFVAEFLLKVGGEIASQEYSEVAQHAINYTVNDQTSLGAFDYEGPPTLPKKHYDNYHTGFVLRMLHSIWHLNGDTRIKASLDLGLKFYMENLFTEAIPIFKPGKEYPIDVHSVAEAVNCLSELSLTYPEVLSQARKTLLYGIDRFQDREGYFYHGEFKSRLLLNATFVSKIPHFRWGQAWMLRAFSSFIKAESNISRHI